MNIPGFTTESLAAVEEMLYGESPWKEQFLTGKTNEKLPRENKTTIAQGLQDMDIDSRPGRQRGNEGKQKEQSSDSISPVALPKGNPQQGPRSRSDLKGLAMFDEVKCPTPKPKKPPELKSITDQQQQSNNQGVTKDAVPKEPKPQDAAAQAERERKKQMCAQKNGAGQGAGVGVTFEENCRQKPQPRSAEQRQATQQAQQAAQQQGQTFDQQPQQQVQDLGRQGGQAERKPTLPICTN
jgi:hypothetical protein